MITKSCTTCKISKQLHYFHLSSRSKDGHFNKCKVCHCQTQRERNQKANTGHFLIYKVKSPSGKVYIGLTKKNLGHRRKRHELDAMRGSLLIFHRAIRKYGADHFQWSVIRDGIASLSEACRLEKDFIISENSQIPSGYNATAGGEGVRGHEVTNETRRRLSEAATGKRHPFKTRRCGPRTEEHRLKCRAAAKSRMVAVVDQNGVVYDSVAEAARSLGLSHGLISQILQGRRSQTKGFTFKRVGS